MIVPFSQPKRIDRKRFWALFRTPMTLQPPPPILLYIRGSLEYNNSLQITLSWQLLSPLHFLPPALACLSLCACTAWKPITLLQTLCCKIFVLKYFRRTSTLQKVFNTNIFPTKISYNKNFPIYCMWRVCLVAKRSIVHLVQFSVTQVAWFS